MQELPERPPAKPWNEDLYAADLLNDLRDIQDTSLIIEVGGIIISVADLIVAIDTGSSIGKSFYDLDPVMVDNCLDAIFQKQKQEATRKQTQGGMMKRLIGKLRGVLRI